MTEIIPKEYYPYLWVGFGTCVVIITFFFAWLVFAIVKTLKRLNKTLDIADEKIKQIGPVLEGIPKIEDKIYETLNLIDTELEKLEMDFSKLVNELTKIISNYRELEEVLEERLREDVPPLLNETKELVSGANEVARDVQAKIKTTDNLFKALDEAGQTVHMVTSIVKGGFTGLAIQLASMAVGVKRSLEYVSENIHEKRR